MIHGSSADSIQALLSSGFPNPGPVTAGDLCVDTKVLDAQGVGWELIQPMCVLGFGFEDGGA